MADNSVSVRIKSAIKSASDWSTLNPTLLNGEIGLDSTNKLIYVGNGTTAFNSLIPWNALPTNHVTTDTDQNITGTKTFVGQKKVLFKQSGSSDKLGFTLYTNSGTEKGYLEFNPSNNVDGYPLMTLGNYASANGGITQVGFRRYSGVSGANGAYNLLIPLIADAKSPFSLTTTYTNFYLPLGFTNGTTTVKTAKSGLVDLSSIIPTIPTLADVATSGDYNDLINKPTIPTTLADLSSDSTHRVVTDTEKTTWNNKSDFSGSYNDLTDKPTIPSAQVQSDWSQSDNTQVDFIKNKPTLSTVATSGNYDDLTNKPTIPPAQVQSDWGQADNSEVDYIKNKPTLGTASAKDVPASGNASTSQVVMGNDTRLSDSRPASDVSAWAKESTKPSYSYSEITDTPTLATVATTGAYSDLSGTPTLATVASSGAYSDLSGTPTLSAVATSGDYTDLSNTPTLATVATSGSYTDLSNTPTIPAAQVNSDWNSVSGVSQILNKPTLSAVATSGDYEDLINTPMEIPSISSGDAGKSLVVNQTEDGVEWAEVGGSSLPPINVGDAGKVLAVNSNEDGAEWSGGLIELSSSVNILDNSVQSGFSSITLDLNNYKDLANSQIAQNADAINSVSSDVTSLDSKYEGITQNIQTDITTLENGAVADNTAFRQSAQNGVYEGLLYYDNGTAVYGTAVGQLSFTTENGNKVIDRTGYYTVYTGGIEAHYQDTTLVYYMQNGRFYSGNSEGQVQTFGRYIVEDDPNDGLVFKWGG